MILTSAILFGAFVIGGLGVLVGSTRTAALYEKEIKRELTKRTILLQAASHELRTPLNNILGLITALQDPTKGKLSPQQILKQLSGSATTLHKMLLDVLEIFQMSEKNLEIDRQIVNISELTQNLAAFYNGALAKRNLNLQIDCTTPKDIWIETDPVRVRQCLTALLKQSIFQTKSGRIIVELRIDEKNTAATTHVSILISDNSEGLSPELANLFFSPEAYDKNPHLHGRPAAMLSLNLARGIANILGGDITATSAAGQGVSFSFKIIAKSAAPLAPSVTPNIADNDELRPTTNGDCLISGTDILIVDDNETNQLVLEGFLSTYQHGGVTTASNGRAAVELAKSNNFDLIFMDILMPDIDGLEATKKIRKLGAHNATVPIIAVSAGSRVINNDTCMKAGMDGYIEKPINEDVLRSEIKKVVPKIKKPVPKAA